MRLLSLRLLNFRQHAESEIHFGSGLTGIFGPNGAGKSTLLEAIAWAIYGSEAARGTNETIRFARAGARSRVEVELRFALGGHEYRVVRTLNQAEVFLDGGGTPVATGVGGATRYLQGRLGMTRREFFNTYFTGQKELQFLAAMGPADRGRFLSQVLGYERLRLAQEGARRRRNELRHEIAGIQAAMGSLDEILVRRAAAEERLRLAHAELASAQAERAEATSAAAAVAPRWSEAQAARERHRDLSHAIELATGEGTTAQRDLARVSAEIEAIESAAAELAALREQLEPLPSVTAEYERLSELSRLAERRASLQEQLSQLAQELAGSAERIERIARAPELVRRYAEERDALRGELRAAEAELDQRRTGWLRDKQDAETKLQGFRERGHELKEQIRGIRAAGAEGKCPTCERPLGTDFERVVRELEDQLAAVIQDGKWWKQRFQQLEAKPEELLAAERRVADLAQALEEKGSKLARCEAVAVELAALREEHEARTARQRKLQADLEAVPEGYDRAVHKAVEAQLQTLRSLEKRATGLEVTVARRPGLQRERDEAQRRAETAAARAAAAIAERETLAFSEAAFDALREEHDRAEQRQHAADLQVTRLEGDLQRAEDERAAAGVEEAEYRRRAREVEEREDELRHHQELDDALSSLRSELNARVRPELSEIASAFLAQLTDGRYTALEIDDAYNIMVLDEGEEKPVISGGEEDVANLVLRLSLSQMIAERAGHPLSLLILDEVFGSLDLARRDNVVRLLRGLEDRFDQVILITHIDGIRETLDQVLRVEFDERTGSSIVRSESLTGPDLPPDLDLAAD